MIDEIGKKGAKAKSAVVDLIGIVESDSSDRVKAAAIRTLEKIGDAAAVSSIVKALEDGDPDVCFDAFRALETFGPKSKKEAIRALINIAGKGKGPSRSDAINSLGQIGPAAKDAVPVLIDEFRYDDDRFRWRMIESKSPAVVRPLIRKMAANRRSLNENSVHALVGIGPCAVPALRRALSSSYKSVRRYSAQTLGLMGPEAGDAVPELIRLLDDKYEDARVNAVVALGRIRSKAQAAIPRLRKIYEDKKCNYRYTAATALCRIAPSPDILEHLIDEIRNDQAKMSNDQLRAINALREIGPAAEPAIPALIECAKNGNPTTRGCAVAVLGKIGPGAEQAVDTLIEALKDADYNVQCHAARALGQIGAAAAGAVPALVETVNSAQKPDLRGNAIRSLAEIGAGCEQAVESLIIIAMGDYEKISREKARIALDKIEPGWAKKAHVYKPPTHKVSGRILTEPAGMPAAGVGVELRRNRRDGSLISHTTRTAEDGTYSFTDVETGEYVCGIIETAAGIDALTVRMVDEDVQADDLYTGLGQSISGTVRDVETGRGLPFANIKLAYIEPAQSHARHTDMNGKYRFFLRPGRVYLYSGAAGDSYLTADGSYGEFSVKDVKLAKRISVGIEPGEHLTGVDLLVTCGPRFSGQVTYSDGKAASDIDVIVEMYWPRQQSSLSGGGIYMDYSQTGHRTLLKTDEDGRFTGYIRFHETKLFIIACSADHSSFGLARYTPIEGSTYYPHMKIVLEPAGSAMIRITDPDGNSVEDARIKIERTLAFPRSGMLSTASDVPTLDYDTEYIGRGYYRFSRLIGGVDYQVWATAAGYNPHCIGVQPKEFTPVPGEELDAGTFQIDWWDDRAVPGLIEKFKSEDRKVRATAVLLLGKLGAKAKDAVPLLIEIMQHEQSNTVRGQAAAALGKIGPDAKTALPVLIKTLKYDSYHPRLAAAEALGLIDDPAALPALREALENSTGEHKEAIKNSIQQLEKHLKSNTLSR